MSEREELVARADKYLNTGSGEYASEIMRDMADYIRRAPSDPAQCAPISECCREDVLAWEPCPPFQELQNENEQLRAQIAALSSTDGGGK